MSEVAIRVQNLSKRYRIRQRERYKLLSDRLNGLARLPLRALGFSRNGHDPQIRHAHSEIRTPADTIWALKDVSFEVKRGEVVGIIGRNGAGKSTLLKILSRITEPTEGEVEVRGRVGSLLEVGTGFHPELTGRENIYLNGAILGMKREEIRRRFDEIVAFAEIEPFLDTPVKHYSSGMYVRLAFSVAAHLDPEILLVDEVLAVGDAAFQKKCLGKMGDVAREGRTVVFVSHNLETVQRLCDRCVLITAGRIRCDGEPATVVASYLATPSATFRSTYRHPLDAGTVGRHRATLLEAGILDASGRPCESVRFGEPFGVRMVWKQPAPIPAVAYAIRAYDRYERFVFAANTLNASLAIESAGVHEVTCEFEYNPLVPGDYRLTIGCYVRPHTEVCVVDSCLDVRVIDVPFYEEHTFNIAGSPSFCIRAKWSLS